MKKASLHLPVLLVALVILFDQLSKQAILNWLPLGGVYPLSGYFNLVLAFNTGAAFSFLHDAGGWQNSFFIGLALLVSVWLVTLLWRHRQDRLFSIALALVLGGALGNVCDRARFGAVVDFLDFHWGGVHFPAFNAADSAITLGVFLLLLHQWRAK